MGLLDRFKIAHKLPLAVVGLALLVGAGTGTAAYFVGLSTVNSQREQALYASVSAASAQVRDYFSAIDVDLKLFAARADTVAALENLVRSYNELKGGSDPAVLLRKAYVTNNTAEKRSALDTANGMGGTYDAQHKRFHPGFRLLLEERSYSDVYLVSPQGAVVYSTAKNDDFATDLTGLDTGLARAATAAAAAPEGGVVFEDFSDYAPAGGVPTAFVAAPVYKSGAVVGVMVLSVPATALSARLAAATGLGQTGEVLLVGSDGLLRSDSRFSSEPTALKSRFEAAPIAASLKTGQQAIGAGAFNGTDMVVASTPLENHGASWAVVAAQGRDEIMAPVIEMRNGMIAVGGILLLVAAAVGALFSRSISRPLTRMSQTMEVLASGDLSVAVEGGERGDEIGAMARALEVFRENAHKMADMTEEERAASIRRRNDRAEMMQALQRAFGQVVDAAVAGDFSRRIEVQFDDRELNMLAQSVNNLVSTVDRGIADTAIVLAALAEADLSMRMQGDYEGAFLKLKQDTNRVADKLTDVVGQLKTTSSTLKIATGEILSGANDLSERTSKQAATIEETSAAMEQLAATVLQNAERAREASVVAGTVTRTAEEGGQVMGQANEAMSRIEASSAKISNIIGMIDDIAFQTNLLALNASVEAARAGEAGKGFAVVAVEVRRLAQSAAQASSEVKVLIEQSASEVKGGSRLVADAAAKLEAMLAAARSSNTLMDGIAHESREQASAIDDVNASVRQMDEMTQHNAALVEETNAAIEKTEAQARELDRVVDVFTLSRESEGGDNRVAETVDRSVRGLQRVARAAKAYLTDGNAAVDRDWAEF